MNKNISPKQRKRASSERPVRAAASPQGAAGLLRGDQAPGGHEEDAREGEEPPVPELERPGAGLQPAVQEHAELQRGRQPGQLFCVFCVIISNFL